MRNVRCAVRHREQARVHLNQLSGLCAKAKESDRQRIPPAEKTRKARRRTRTESCGTREHARGEPAKGGSRLMGRHLFYLISVVLAIATLAVVDDRTISVSFLVGWVLALLVVDLGERF
jgi:hypothetical protein